MKFLPWWMCCGWRSGWCVLDTALHEMGIEWKAVCERHDRALARHIERQLDFEPERDPIEVVEFVPVSEDVEDW